MNVMQLATIDRASVAERIGVVPDWPMAQVDIGLARALGLGRR